ncbi:MAG: VanW family protein [Anaerolineae bacterium]|nr:VanW family protein [Anaerolineae bacterium]
MHTSSTPRPNGNGRFTKNISYFLIAPLTALVILSMVFAYTVSRYKNQHADRIYTGVTMLGIDLGGMTPDEAKAILADAVPYTNEEAITLTDPASGQQWTKTPAELGVAYDLDQTVETAYNIGRTGGPLNQFQEMFNSWYYGIPLAPTIIFDENRLDSAVDELAAGLEQPAINAMFSADGSSASYTPSQIGRQLNKADLRERLMKPVSEFRPAEIELLIEEIQPQIIDDGETAVQIQQAVNNPITFYLPEPLADDDISRFDLPTEQLAQWVRVERTIADDGTQQHNMIVDENAVSYWLTQYANDLYRKPENARFYFDDDTKELVLVAPHINGRELDVEATLDAFLAQVNTPNRSVPLIVKAIEPTVHSDATAEELGITELISEKVTWFYGSSDERKHNIARAAANFYGIVIAPYEEFSFNDYLGTISEDDGYTEGLIIVGGQTIKGVGGGVCQVSTTMYQTAFWAGFPITSRLEHGYWLTYYNDGEGPGMDATVYSPDEDEDPAFEVDLKFINNTPYHLLMENYYSAENEALTFKFYSTSMGRTIKKDGPYFENVTEIPGSDQDRWEYDEDLAEGEVKQIDWATEGADAYVTRTVINADGEVIEERTFISHYIPYPNTYHYGPGVEPYDYSLVPEDPFGN